jgi:hypothetical protein
MKPYILSNSNIQDIRFLRYNLSGFGGLEVGCWPLEPKVAGSNQRHRAVLWFVAHIALYSGQQRKELTHTDYMDFLRRHRWKLYQTSRRRELVGNYLNVIDLNTRKQE